MQHRPRTAARFFFEYYGAAADAGRNVSQIKKWINGKQLEHTCLARERS